MRQKTSLPAFLLAMLVVPVDVVATPMVRTIPVTISQEQAENHKQKGIVLKGIIRIVVENRLKEYSELSGLSWDKDEGILYAISDKGYINHIIPKFEGDELVQIEFKSNHQLKDQSNAELSSISQDSEGLTLMNSNNGIKGDSELLISFERQPRVERYNAYGKWLSTVEIPDELQQVDFYEHGNNALESIEVHPEKGILIAAERLKGNPATLSLFDQKGQQWSLQAASSKYGSATGMSLTSDNNILLLERVFSNVFMGVRFALHHVVLGQKGLQHERLAYIGQEDGLFNDNFEGITHHKNDHYFMIADDNRNPLQRAVLVYFYIPKLDQQELKMP